MNNFRGPGERELVTYSIRLNTSKRSVCQSDYFGFLVVQTLSVELKSVQSERDGLVTERSKTESGLHSVRDKLAAEELVRIGTMYTGSFQKLFSQEV